MTQCDVISGKARGVNSLVAFRRLLLPVMKDHDERGKTDIKLLTELKSSSVYHFDNI